MEQENIVESKPSTVKSEAMEWIKALLIAAVLVFMIRYFIFAPFIVDGPSMEPNFETGERLIVNKFIYDFRDPRHGEVIVFHAPEGKDYIKRVIALEGETVKVSDNKVYVNGKEVDEDYIRDIVAEKAKNGEKYTADFAEVTVPAGEIFAMGDNRRNSKDSRMIGPQPVSKIVGRADIIFWPAEKIQLVKH